MIDFFFSPRWQWRALEPDDLPSVVDCVKAVYSNSSSPIGGGWSRSQLKNEIEQGGSLAAIYRPFGVTCFVLWQALPEVFEIRFLATHPQWQRRGLMLRLLQSVIQQVPVGLELWLEVHEGNPGACNLYEQLGFLKSAKRPKYYRDGADALLYTLPSLLLSCSQ